MFGAIYGDVIGSYFESHCTKDYDFVFQNESSFTDDTVLTVAVCKAILNNPETITRRHCANEAWNMRDNIASSIHITHTPDLEICFQNGQGAIAIK